jgi:hypothetical protein
MAANLKVIAGSATNGKADTKRWALARKLTEADQARRAAVMAYLEEAYQKLGLPAARSGNKNQDKAMNGEYFKPMAMQRDKDGLRNHISMKEIKDFIGHKWGIKF